ncbi:MAG TPA: hypothetical protein VE870_16305, partial [Bacteroidales bacterium]|nr:hypothetical protein [Bacteroidales bacterium]
MKTPTKKQKTNVFLLMVLFTSILYGSCKKDNVKPVDTAPKASFNLDKGSTGIVIDTREIFRKGYKPVRAEIHFQDYPAFESTLAVDTFTCIATYKIDSKRLTDQEKTAFNNGVVASIDIFDRS